MLCDKTKNLIADASNDGESESVFVRGKVGTRREREREREERKVVRKVVEKSKN